MLEFCIRLILGGAASWLLEFCNAFALMNDSFLLGILFMQVVYVFVGNAVCACVCHMYCVYTYRNVLPNSVYVSDFVRARPLRIDTWS